VFHELMTLRHYLHDISTVTEMVSAILERQPAGPLASSWSHPTQGPIPSEYVHFLRRGLSKDREARFASAQEMIALLEEALEGKIRVQCHVTMTKRMAREAGRFVDRRPHLSFAL